MAADRRGGWFGRITGFDEAGYETTQARLSVAGGTLAADGRSTGYRVGRLEVPSLAELRRASADTTGAGGTRVSVVQGDARALHARPEHRGALFQVASQFNLLEMTSYEVSPEQGVERYAGDATQGPACAMAAGAATIFRNYLVPFPDGSVGQRLDSQIDCLSDLGALLGNGDGSLWTMRNGYALPSADGLERIDAMLRNSTAETIDALRAALRIGVHRGVDVTDLPPGHAVSQAFCSALPVSYSNLRVPRARWEGFATLVLEAAYEATLRVAFLERASGGSGLVFLTRLGGGAFGNDTAWIHHAMSRALDLAAHWALDVRIVTFAAPDAELLQLARCHTSVG